MEAAWKKLVQVAASHQDDDPAGNHVGGEGSHNGCDVHGEEAVAQKAHGLEEADIPSQQHHVHCQHHRARRARPKHKLHPHTARSRYATAQDEWQE